LTELRANQGKMEQAADTWVKALAERATLIRAGSRLFPT
jgi:hypothetical protein